LNDSSSTGNASWIGTTEPPGGVVVEAHDGERSGLLGLAEVEQVREEAGGGELVARADDGVVDEHTHVA
jgi:hypothetical protein